MLPHAVYMELKKVSGQFTNRPKNKQLFKEIWECLSKILDKNLDKDYVYYAIICDESNNCSTSNKLVINIATKAKDSEQLFYTPIILNNF